MPQRDRENVPYFNSATESVMGVMGKTVVTKDEQEYSTLKAIHVVLKEAVEALYKDFNAFQAKTGLSKAAALYDLQRQIDGKQVAYDILAPTLEAVTSALQAVDSKYKEN